MINRFRFLVIFFFLLISSGAFAQDARGILEKSYSECIKLTGGSYKMLIEKKSLKDKIPAITQATCQFLKPVSDSVSWKFYIRMGNGDGMLCTGNDLIIFKGVDSTGVVYSKNQSEYKSAFQSEGFFPPFFQPRTIFNLDRLRESTIVLRKTDDEKVMDKDCYVIHLFDLSRVTRPGSEKQEKIFFIDKQTFLPLGYSEVNSASTPKNSDAIKDSVALKNKGAVTPVKSDTIVKREEFKLKELEVSDFPHDSVFIYKNIPPWFRLRTMLGSVYHHHLKTRTAAPDFKGKIAGGDSLSLESLKGKKVLLFFFSRSSYPSLKALNTVQHLQNTFKNVEVLLLSIDRGERSLLDLLRRRNISLKAIANAKSIADDYYITAAPAFIIIDAKGIVRNIQTGFGEGMEESLLKKISVEY